MAVPVYTGTVPVQLQVPYIPVYNTPRSLTIIQYIRRAYTVLYSSVAYYYSSEPNLCNIINRLLYVPYRYLLVLDSETDSSETGRQTARQTARQ